MRGPLFDRVIRDIPPGEAKDFEALYTIIITERCMTRAFEPEDERIALMSLCALHWPGKTPSYRAGAAALRRRFRGIATNQRRQQKFRESLSRSLLTTHTVEDLDFNAIERLFRGRGQSGASPLVR